MLPQHRATRTAAGPRLRDAISRSHICSPVDVQACDIQGPPTSRYGFMGLRSLRLAGFKTLFAGSRRQNLCVHMATRDSQLPGSGHQARFYGPWKLVFGRLQNPFRGARPQNLHMHMATRESKATRQGFMGLRSLRLAGFKTLFAGSRRQNLRVHMATRDSQATRQGFMGLRSLRLAGFKTLFAGSRPLNLRLHMATRQGLNGPASKAFSRGYPALRPPGKVLQGFMGLRNLRLAGFKTLFAGPGLKTFTCTWLQGSQRPPGKVLWAFEACVWPASKPFSRGPGVKTFACTWLQGTLSYPAQATTGKVLWALETCVWPASKPFSRGPASKPSHAHGHKGVKGHPARFYGPSKLAFGRLQNPFRGVPASKPARAHGYMTLRPPGKVLWAFEACVWPASKPFSLGPGLKTFACTWLIAVPSRPQNLRMHMATRDFKGTRQGFMGL